ncbi:hypothetical protein RSAG8_05446, partial [Rhizoctonia solani AG-8 WAC10335]
MNNGTKPQEALQVVEWPKKWLHDFKASVGILSIQRQSRSAGHEEWKLGTTGRGDRAYKSVLAEELDEPESGKLVWAENRLPNVSKSESVQGATRLKRCPAPTPAYIGWEDEKKHKGSLIQADIPNHGINIKDALKPKGFVKSKNVLYYTLLQTGDQAAEIGTYIQNRTGKQFKLENKRVKEWAPKEWCFCNKIATQPQGAEARDELDLEEEADGVVFLQQEEERFQPYTRVHAVPTQIRCLVATQPQGAEAQDELDLEEETDMDLGEPEAFVG